MAAASLLDASPEGFGACCEFPIPLHTPVGLRDESDARVLEVRHCTADGATWIIVLTERENAHHSAPEASCAESENFYEFMQISPTAQTGTIQRVYRYLAGRYHPDNPETGDSEKFLLLTRAYRVLSDPDARAEYDAKLNRGFTKPSPAFVGIEFLDGTNGELNRRLAVLAVLYKKCRANVNDARVSLVDLEAQMGFPREYLDFTTWYLRSKKLITREDNSDFALTADGVDFIEENFERFPVLRKLLTPGNGL